MLKPPETEEDLVSFKRLTRYESQVIGAGKRLVAGVDEAGRGPLAGPVVAAACILPPGLHVPGLADSKRLSVAAREQYFHVLTSHSEVMYGVGIVDAELIDEINIYQATMRAMREAVDALPVAPDHLLVDGLHLTYPGVPCLKLIKGDSLSLSIMAGAVIAKVTRDALMCEYDRQWPEYGFARHKGYGTKAHREAILRHGPCAIHRRSFEPIKSLPVSVK